jgi:hypothetical protein
MIRHPLAVTIQDRETLVEGYVTLSDTCPSHLGDAAASVISRFEPDHAEHGDVTD